MTAPVLGQGTRFPSSRKKTKKEPPPPEEAAMKKARRLPLSGPGIPVKVPLDCFLEYMALQGLVPVEFKNPYLIVRRHPKVKNDKSNNEK